MARYRRKIVILCVHIGRMAWCCSSRANDSSFASASLRNRLVQGI